MRIVTAYYSIPSKQPREFYMEHIKNFFSYIKAPVVFFTDQKNYTDLSSIAPPNIEFRIKPFEEMIILQDFPPEFWKLQNQRDPQPYHTWQLGALWANKKGFVKVASELYPDDWFLWVDAGCIRKPTWKEYANNTALRDYPLEPGVYIQCLNRMPLGKTVFTFPDQHLAGALIAFHRKYIDTFIKEYDKMLATYNSIKVSGISDQYIMASLNVNRKPYIHFVERMQMTDYVQTCPDAWFFFLAWL